MLQPLTSQISPQQVQSPFRAGTDETRLNSTVVCAETSSTEVELSQWSQNLSIIDTSSVTDEIELWSQKAHADPEAATSLLNALRDSVDTPLLDISNYPDIRLSATGQKWTESVQEAYTLQAQRVSTERQVLISHERAQGVPEADILDHVFAHILQQGPAYSDPLSFTKPVLTQHP